MFKIFNKLLSRNAPYRFDFSRAKQICRILLIDDDSDALPIDDLKRDDYNIEQRKRVDPDLLRQCETGTYDLIVLDYNGVAPASICPNDGFGVFDRIRSNNPEQYIVAISAQTYDISKTEYFRKANSYLKKPTDLVSTKKVLDDGIKQLYNREYLLDSIRNTLLASGISKRKCDKLIQNLRKDDIKSYGQVEEITSSILKASDDIDKIRSLLTRLGKVVAL